VVLGGLAHLIEVAVVLEAWRVAGLHRSLEAGQRVLERQGAADRHAELAGQAAQEEITAAL
jgi:hypothetical protein